MEIDYLLDMSDGELVTYDSSTEEVKAAINWWLATPQGELWGDPSWGNKLVQFKHDPEATSTEVAMEAHILTKMSADLSSVSVDSVSCSFSGDNEMTLIVWADNALIETTYDRANS